MFWTDWNDVRSTDSAVGKRYTLDSLRVPFVSSRMVKLLTRRKRIGVWMMRSRSRFVVCVIALVILLENFIGIYVLLVVEVSYFFRFLVSSFD